MGQAKPASLRLKIVQARQAEQLSFTAIANRYEVSYNTVRNICRAYEEHGQSGLVPNYTACGRKVKESAQKVYRLVRLVRHFHPDWGIPYILTRIECAFPQLPLQSIRTYQRRLSKELPQQELPSAQVPRIKSNEKVRQAHDEWQIDAKERIELPSGEKVCYLNITDTKSHGILKAKPFSPQSD